ncbi:hypothetical protein [Lentzea sp. NBRC 102530]|uniref:hypothetical protein n=1 Tax=Lentzea sp. NBRC 102530 TaxID=3032201 RepID=UPI0024A4F8B9|nr:hypothetical protein [Lentzea sp. NBRC 102530]GLY47785.1 hypothetical protein Lesp01_14410 [Lentzea sp. NBRC 102530]
MCRTCYQRVDAGVLAWNRGRDGYAGDVLDAGWPRLVARLRIPGRRPRRGPDTAPARDSAARLVVLRSLLEVTTRAVALQPHAVQVIDACALPGDVPAQVAGTRPTTAAGTGERWTSSATPTAHRRNTG